MQPGIMRLLTLLITIMLTFSVTASEQSFSSDNLPPYSLNYDPERDPFMDGHAAIALAQETGRRILIEVGGDWCKWCHIMERFFDDNPDIKSRLHQTFVILKVNVSDTNDNSKFLSSFPKPLGYPHMYVSELNGALLISKDTADFLADGKYSRQKFLEFFQQWSIRKDS